MANIKNAAAKADLRGAVQVTVHDSLTGAPLVNAAIKLYKAQTQQGAPMLECDVEEVRKWLPDEALLVATGFTASDGAVLFPSLDAGAYIAALTTSCRCAWTRCFTSARRYATAAPRTSASTSPSILRWR
jgi:hypothetical protein